jgi:ribosome biogenesis GTPase
MNPIRDLPTLGWNLFFEQQLDHNDSEQWVKARVAAHHGSQIIVFTVDGEIAIPIQLTDACEDLAVGDWVLLDPDTFRGTRRLERESLIARKAAGDVARQQLIAANIDTLFIVSSCNQDFNLSRLERYLAVAIEARTTPIVVLTKADLCEDATSLRQQVERLHSGLLVEFLDARCQDQTESLGHWCRSGQTVALVGSSGVGKSTLANSLGAGELATAEIRESDDKGRHTTTARSMHRMRFGGWLIDNPGMRELQLTSCEQGVDDLFEDVVELSRQCRFTNCRHAGDTGCALESAVETGLLEARRLTSYLKLRSEQERNSATMAQRREKDRRMGKLYKSIQANNRKVKKD